MKTVEAGAAISGAKLEANAKRKKAKASTAGKTISELKSDDLPDL